VGRLLYAHSLNCQVSFLL